MTSAPADETLRMGSARGRWVLLTTVLGSGLAMLDATVVNVALGRVGEDLDADFAGLQWTINAYTLTLAALILLGLGWNFGFIGATAIITSSYRPHEADKVQGFHDIVLFGTVALSSFSSGKVFTAWGWSVMNLVIWPVAGLCLLLVLSLVLTSRKKAA